MPPRRAITLYLPLPSALVAAIVNATIAEYPEIRHTAIMDLVETETGDNGEQVMHVSLPIDEIPPEHAVYQDVIIPRGD